MSVNGDTGDRNPSDIGDVAPTPQVFSEKDYTPFRESATNIKSYPTRQQASPLQPAMVPTEIKRDYFTGIPTKKIDDYTYGVIRQDGRYITATTFVGGSNDYQEVPLGELCVVMSGEIKDLWYIVSPSKNKPLSAMTKYNVSAQGPSNTILLPDLNGTNTLVGDKIEPNFGLSFKVMVETVALYHVTLSVTLESKENDPFTKTAATCDVVDGPNVKVAVGSKRIIFDRNKGFKVTHDGGYCRNSVTLDIGTTKNHALISDTDGAVRWSDSVVLDGHLKVGLNSEQGWVIIQDKSDHQLWLGHGQTTQKLLFPDAKAKAGSFLIADRIKDNVAQLKWTDPAGQGSIKAYKYLLTETTTPINVEVSVYGYADDDHNVYATGSTVIHVPYFDIIEEIKEWMVKDGLVMSGPDIEKRDTSSGSITTQPLVRKYWTCNDA